MTAPRGTPIQTAIRYAQKLRGSTLLIANALLTAFRLGYEMGRRENEKSPADSGDKKESPSPVEGRAGGTHETEKSFVHDQR